MHICDSSLQVAFALDGQFGCFCAQYRLAIVVSYGEFNIKIKLSRGVSGTAGTNVPGTARVFGAHYQVLCRSSTASYLNKKGKYETDPKRLRPLLYIFWGSRSTLNSKLEALNPTGQLKSGENRFGAGRSNFRIVLGRHKAN